MPVVPGAPADDRQLPGLYREKQQRLSDGTLARNRPLANTLWLDDLFMSVPALAQMGVLTGERRYFDDAVKQVPQFSERMFNRNLNILYAWLGIHDPHPGLHWARANGWAFLAMTELLDVCRRIIPGMPVLAQYQARPGIAALSIGKRILASAARPE